MENNDYEYNEMNNMEGEEEEFDDDLYLAELHKRLAMMKNERKRAEQDTKLLDNRLNLLKGEEEKTWKKIAQTKKKTNEKIFNLQKMADMLRQKEMIKEYKEREIENKKMLNQQMRNEIRHSLQMKKEEKMRQINEEAKLLKMQKQYNEELAKFIKMEEMNNNRNKYETVKGQHMVIEEKKRALEMERKLKIKMELEKKLLEEMRLKEEAENKLTQIEQEEIEILKRIKTTTQVHKAMCDEFEKISIQDIYQQNYQGMNDIENDVVKGKVSTKVWK